MFGSIFNTYRGAPFLCCTTTDLGIFGFAFVIALRQCLFYCSDYFAIRTVSGLSRYNAEFITLAVW